MFADDSLLFCKATIASCHKLKHIIDELCTLSGQLVNFHKTTQYCFSKIILNARKDALAGVFKMTKSISLGRYLGARFSGYVPNKQDYNQIMQKNEQHISLWQANFLSKPGRSVLIQSNLKALPAYICSSFLLPKNIAKKLGTAHPKFFWNSKPDH